MEFMLFLWQWLGHFLSLGFGFFPSFSGFFFYKDVDYMLDFVILSLPCSKLESFTILTEKGTRTKTVKLLVPNKCKINKCI